MNRYIKKYITLFSTFFVFFIIWVILVISGRTAGKTIPQVKNIVEVKKLEIDSETYSNIVMYLSNDNWYLYPEGYIVDEEYIGEILSLLSNFEVVDFVSKGENLSIFELDSKKRYKLSLEYGTGKSLTVYFGKTAPTRKHTYIQLSGDQNVYLGRGNFYFALHRSKEEFRSKKILAFKNEDVLSISWNEGDKIFSIYPAEDLSKSFRWKASWKSGELDSKKISNFLLILNPLFTTQFMDRIPEAKQVLRKLTIKTRTNTFEVFVHSQNKEGDYYISIKGSKNYYKITKIAGDNLMIGHTNF